MLPVEANTKIAFPTVNFSSVVPKTAIVTIVLTIPVRIDMVQTMVRLVFILVSPAYHEDSEARRHSIVAPRVRQALSRCVRRTAQDVADCSLEILVRKWLGQEDIGA